MPGRVGDAHVGVEGYQGTVLLQPQGINEGICNACVFPGKVCREVLGVLRSHDGKYRFEQVLDGVESSLALPNHSLLFVVQSCFCAG